MTDADDADELVQCFCWWEPEYQERLLSDGDCPVHDKEPQ